VLLFLPLRAWARFSAAFKTPTQKTHTYRALDPDVDDEDGFILSLEENTIA
jgi:hypothetical protein